MRDVELVDIDPVTEPDPSDEGAYGVYAVLSCAPDVAWQQEFERQWRQIPHGVKRRMTVVGDRLRMTVGKKDHLVEVLGLARELVAKTNQDRRAGAEFGTS